MAKIKIRRSSEYYNRMRAFKIFIDGQQVGRIYSGETKVFVTTAGKHTVTAKIDWCSSQVISINIGDNETKSLKVGGFKYSKWVMPFIPGIIVLSIILLKTMDFGYTVFLLVPIFLLMAYYRTIGRKNYLTLNENN